MAKKKSEHYVNNKEFSNAVVEYVKSANDAITENKEAPIITPYIGDCFMKICEGLSHKSNFSGYSYREDMVLDALENCVKAIMNFNLDKATRTGLPNAFSYFTQISYFAFLRRIAKENKQWDIKMKYIESASLESFAEFGDDDFSGDSLIAKIRTRSDSYKYKDFNEVDDETQKPIRKPFLPKKAKHSSTANLFNDIDN